MKMKRMISSSPAQATSLIIFLTLNMILCVHSQVAPPMYDFETAPQYEVLPANSQLFVGEKLKLLCKISDDVTTTKSSDLYMNFVPKSNAEWNETALNTTDEKTAWIDINITEMHAPHTLIYCKNKKDNKILAESIVYVERPIKSIVDFKGEYLYNDELTVTWDLGETYFNMDFIKVKTAWLNLASPSENYSRNCTSETYGSCTIKKKYPVNFEERIGFKIKVCSSTKIRPEKEFLQPLFEICNESSQFFDINQNTKAGPPLDLTITNRSSTCFSLTWINSTYLKDCTYCQHIYQIDIRQESEEESQFRKILNSTDQAYPQKYAAVHVCNLKPFTSYVLRLQIKGDEYQPWSDPSEIKEITKEDRPLTGPQILNTGYHDAGCVDNTKQVIVYWNDMETNTRQGILTSYEVLASNRSITLRPGTNNFKTEVKCTEGGVIQIFAATEVGPSLRPSAIYIPSDAETLAAPPGINLTVEEYIGGNSTMGMKDITVRWSVNSVDAHNLKLLFYMCREYYEPKLCLDDHNVTEVNFSDEILNLTLIDVGTHLFGYALEQVNVTKRGIEWTDCVFQADKSPGQPKGLAVREDRRGGPLTISWTSEPCDKANKALVLQYIISVCELPKDETSSCIEIKVNSSTKNIEFEKAKRNQAYEVQIKAATAQHEGQYSAPENVTTTEQEEDPVNEIVGILMGSFVTVIILGISLSCLIWKCHLSRLRFRDHILKFKTDQKPIKRQTSQESGFGTGTPPSHNSEQSTIPDPVDTSSQQGHDLSNIPNLPGHPGSIPQNVMVVNGCQGNDDEAGSNLEPPTTAEGELQHSIGSNSTGRNNPVDYVRMTMEAPRDENSPVQNAGGQTNIATESSHSSAADPSDQTCIKPLAPTNPPIFVPVFCVGESDRPGEMCHKVTAGDQPVTDYVTVTVTGVVAKAGAVSEASEDMTPDQNLEPLPGCKSEADMASSSQVGSDEKVNVSNTCNFIASMPSNEKVFPENLSSGYVHSVRETLRKNLSEESVSDSTSQGYNLSEESVSDSTSQGYNLSEESVSDSTSQGYNLSEESVSDSTSQGYNLSEESVSDSTSQGYIANRPAPSSSNNASQVGQVSNSVSCNSFPNEHMTRDTSSYFFPAYVQLGEISPTLSEPSSLSLGSTSEDSINVEILPSPAPGAASDSNTRSESRI
ncbi:unnamed protein product [Lymnaea stagnalis]|uniref:Fibronectin type-III domain-containing protein n=1 Tax=Lymnaea stagnalis TaxID=6523 RepID=A0AAV2HQG8_LYMST